MASISLFSVGKTILEKLGPFVQQEAALLWNLRSELKKLDGTMTSIQALLLDAEEQQEHSHQVKDWLQKLELLLLDADDLLDDVATEALREEATTQDHDGSSCKIGCWAAVCFLLSVPNRLIYGLKMAHKVKTLREQLEAIHADNTKLHLTPRFEETGKTRKHTPTISSIPDIFVGREDDAKKIKELLLANDSRSNVSVVSIVGIGGMGKTALAQLVYNDKKVDQEFNSRMWVCVSESFEVDVLVQKILEAATGGKQPGLQLQTLASQLEGYISGKKYLLVLDDVWNFDLGKWEVLRSILNGGGSGSKILVTTRIENYATMMNRGSSHPPHVLKGLSSPQSWSLLRLVVSGGDHQLANEPHNTINVEEIQTEVMKKSVGVPLAVKTLASLLYFKNPQTEWLSFLRSDKLLSADQEGSILHNLKLSYDYLPSHLKRCFVLCSLFPKDYEIDVNQLIYKWIALGLIKSSPNGSKQSLFSLGLEYLMDLTWRSFFQEIKRGWLGNIESCKMHDLIHDLAVSIAGHADEITENTWYISLNHDLWCPSELASHLAKAKRLRAFNVPYKKWYQSGTTWDEFSFKTFVSNSGSLRVLDFKNSGMEVLPHHLQELKHLRYLNLAFNDKISRLPSSVTMLQNLQVLNLCGCRSLLEFPKDFNKLVNLWVLNCRDCFALTHMPVGLGELSRLERLSWFVVGRDSSVHKHRGGLSELKNLNNLRGILQIVNLGHLRGTKILSSPSLAFTIGGEANLKGKTHLEHLSLLWDDGNTRKGREEMAACLKGCEEDVQFDESLLESLQPHSNLKTFSVKGYIGRRLPIWMNSLNQLVTLQLAWCKLHHELHHLQGLPILEKLILGGLIELEHMDEDEDVDSWVMNEGAQKNESKPFFPSLKDLALRGCPRLKGWRRKPPQFPKLSKLVISQCPLLTSMPSFPRLDTELELLYSNIQPLLDTMNMSVIGHIVPSSTSCSSSSLYPSSSCEVEGLQYPLSKLKKMHIGGIYYPPKEWLHGMQHLTSLQEIRIDECLGLEETLYWHNISHVPNIKICGKYIKIGGEYLLNEDYWNNFPQILQVWNFLLSYLPLFSLHQLSIYFQKSYL
ncbi:unnamed protein product [Linum tenue]|uniref:Uncharacterized protein n=1 Tax=Linum tenue TaxID=586396 RepID=A0AAV0N888_9ROSI|nr:unnamed protein product [Linum tenue]